MDYLVLNYDTVLEDALALERVPFSDGLDGGVTGWWNPETFDRGGLAARVLQAPPINQLVRVSGRSFASAGRG